MNWHVASWVLVGVTVAAMILTGISFAMNANIEKQKAAVKASEDFNAAIMGKTFTLLGNKYAAIRSSGWDGTILCIDDKGREVWMSPETVHALILTQKAEKE